LNNKLTAKPTVKKSIFAKHPEKRTGNTQKSQVYNYGTFKNSNIFNLIDVLSTKKVN
jgi:hypothetical protein